MVKNSNISKNTFRKIRNFLESKNIGKSMIDRERTLPGKTKAFVPTISCFHKDFVHDSKNVLLVLEVFSRELDTETMHTTALDYFLNFDNLYFVIFYFESTSEYKMIFRIENYESLDCGLTDEIPSFKDIVITNSVKKEEISENDNVQEYRIL